MANTKHEDHGGLYTPSNHSRHARPPPISGFAPGPQDAPDGFSGRYGVFNQGQPQAHPQPYRTTFSPVATLHSAPNSTPHLGNSLGPGANMAPGISFHQQGGPTQGSSPFSQHTAQYQPSGQPGYAAYQQHQHGPLAGHPTGGGSNNATQGQNPHYSPPINNSAAIGGGSSRQPTGFSDLEMQNVAGFPEKSSFPPRREQPSFRTNRVIAPMFYWLDVFEPDVFYRWRKAPRVIKKAKMDSSGETYRLRDHMDRVIARREDSRYISPTDGKAKELIIQCADHLFYTQNGESWMRTRIRDKTAWHLRVASWCMSGDKNQDQAKLVGKWIVSMVLLSIPSLFPARSVGKTHNPGRYDRFNYKLHGYPEVSRNINEDPDRWQKDGETGRIERKRANPLNRIEERALGPSLLCDQSSEEFHVNVQNWNAEEKGRPFPEYVFVAFTEEQFPRTNRRLLDILHEIGARAARDADVQYYWVSCSCLPNEKELYRISDIVRAAKRVVIAVGPSKEGQGIMAMLKEFGRRVWTFPEILLSPKDQDGILVYAQDELPLRWTLKQFARDVWEDSIDSRQLIDHFQGSLHLSRIELATIALKCLYSRGLGGKYPGDQAYALMGLLRLRPPINPGETAFQAFARISLLGDNDSLLERLICIQPADPNDPWHKMDDAYHARLWDIYPSCQIAGIGHADCQIDDDVKWQVQDTVIVDGMKGANVRWKNFATVKQRRVFSLKRWLARHTLWYAGTSMWIGVALLALSSRTSSFSNSFDSFSSGPAVTYTDPTLLIPGLLLFLMGLILVAAGPKLLLVIYGGKMWNIQPWLFGIEGYVDIGTLEAQIFGLKQGYLKWSPFGSPLSRHHKDQYGEIVGDDPMMYEDVRKRIEKARTSTDPERQRMFLLVDTSSMTVTLFEAVQPPVAFLVAGSEGGHQRAIGVSYDWKTNTVYRECVLRMETTVRDTMYRVPRVRLGLQRRQPQTQKN